MCRAVYTDCTQLGLVRGAERLGFVFALCRVNGLPCFSELLRRPEVLRHRVEIVYAEDVAVQDTVRIVALLQSQAHEGDVLRQHLPT